MSGYSRARPVTAEDFDEDADTEILGTKVSATTDRHALVRQDAMSRRHSQQSYGRNRSGTMPIEGLARTMTQPTTQTARSSSRSRAASTVPSPPLQRSSSTSRPAHQSSRSTDWRYTLPYRPGATPIQPSASYAQPSQTQPTPRPRSNSTTSARPQSWAGNPYQQSFEVPYQPMPPPQPRGPPPSRSAYPFQQYPAYPNAWTDPQPPFLQNIPVYGGASAQGRPYAYERARTSSQLPVSVPHPMAPSYAMNPPQRPLSRSTASEMFNPRITATSPDDAPRALRRSYRRSRDLRSMPGGFPGDDEVFHESSSEGEDDYFEDSGHDFTADRRSAKRDSLMMPPPPAPRPVGAPLSRSQSGNNVLNLNPRQITYADDLRPSDLRRHSSTRSSRSRQPSVSTAASNRTPATTVSNESHGPYILRTDSRGQQTRQYITLEEYERIKRHYSSQQKLDDAEGYQRRVNGEQQADLTAEKIRQLADRIPAAPRSRESNRSRRSGRSATLSDGFQLSFGNTTLQIDGNASFEVVNDDGGPRLVINPGKGKEKAYYTETSKSSESRAGRSRGGSEQESSRGQRAGRAPTAA